MDNGAATRTRSVPRAITVLELLLVMAIIGVLVGLAWPVLDSSLADAKVQSAADQVRGVLMGARVRAIQQGVPYRFVWTSRTFGYEPVGPKSQRDDASGDESSHTAGKGDDRLREVLPEGVRLVWATPSPSLDVLPDEETDGPLPIVFQPDGTTTDAIWRMVSSGGRSVRIELVGLTGRAKAERLVTARED